MDALDVPALLQPVSESAPSGEDLSAGHDFLRLMQLAEGKPEQQFNDRVYPAQPPDWPAVREAALALWPGTRDLRVAVLLVRSQARLFGLRGAAPALDVLAGLLEQQWPTVYPRLDAEEADDPTERINALNPLVNPLGLPADLRETTLDGDRRSLPLPQAWALATSGDAPEALARRKDLDAMLAQAEERTPGLCQALWLADTAVQRIQAALLATLGTRAPELGPLRSATQGLARAAAARLGLNPGEDAAAASGAPDGAAPASRGPPASTGAPGELHSRADAARVLETVCLWLERNEPAHPAPLLIRRACRLLDKSFIEIIRDLAPDSLNQVERLAGTVDG